MVALACTALGGVLANVATRRAHESRASDVVRQVRFGDASSTVLSLAARSQVKVHWEPQEGADVKRLVLAPVDNRALFLAQTEYVLTFVFDRAEACTQTRVLAADDEDRILSLTQPD